MVVGLQEELSAELYVIALLVHLIDQHGVEVLVLRKRENSFTLTVIKLDIVLVLVLKR